MKQRFVVIGTSAASLAFISKLRSYDKNSEVICISADHALPYNRCFLADFVSGNKEISELYLKPEQFFQEQEIQLRLNTKVTSLDPKQNCIFINDEKVSYDTLFLGIGSKPYIPTIGYTSELNNVSTFYTLHDAQKIIKTVQEKNFKSALIIGGGINGVECASALHEIGLSVGIVERNSQLFATQLEQKTVDMITKQLQRKGISLFLHSTVKNLCIHENNVMNTALQSGSRLLADLVVLATGVTPQNQILTGSSLEMLNGCLIVNEKMQTSVPNIYAAGDICMVPDIITKKLCKSATWPDAMLQGLCAGSQFGSNPKSYMGYIGLRDSHFFGKSFYACGTTINTNMDEVITKQTENSISQFFIKNNRLVGFSLLGDVSAIGQYKQWYLTQKEVYSSDF